MISFDSFLFYVELVSISAFAISGATTAIKKRFDVFGVIIVGITTSIGGGILRDLVLGIHPPKSFSHPVYAGIAALFSLLAFLFEYRYAKTHQHIGIKNTAVQTKINEYILFWLDTIGLAIYTVVGVATAYELSSDYSIFLYCFVGTITGVGGGLMRDLFVGNPPQIFVKHFYAIPCILGSLVCTLFWNVSGRIPAMIAGMGLLVILRFFAARFRWNMPVVPVGSADGNP